MATIFGSNSNNTLIVETDNLRGLGGDDTYIVTNAQANNAGATPGVVTIVDTEGNNRLQLADGLQISRVEVLGGNAIQLTLSNGQRIQVLGADRFTYDIGGNAVASDTQGLTSRTFAQFVNDFGIALTNGAGATAGPVTVQPGTTPVGMPPPPAFRAISLGLNGQLPNGDSTTPHLSADGRYVVFESNASNLVAGDTNGATDVFRTELTTGATVLVSRLGTGGALGNGSSGSLQINDSGAKISSDGRYVVFASNANNLAANDTNQSADVFFKDLQTGETQLVSRSALTGQSAAAFSLFANLSANGRFVLFESQARDLPGSMDGQRTIFRKDMETGSLASVASLGFDGLRGALDANAQISNDGRFVVYSSQAGVQPDVFRKDMNTGATVMVSRVGLNGEMGDSGSFTGDISGSGRYVVFTSGATNFATDDTNNELDVFRKDVETGELLLVSRLETNGLVGNGRSRSAQVSDDGRYVSFLTTADNLSGLVGLALVVKDLQTGSLRTLNRMSFGGQDNLLQIDTAYALSADGQNAVFASQDASLVGVPSGSAVPFVLFTA